ncbi:DUF3857 domain-containing protein [Flavobacterium tyrosinilyticum]|uniref:DUF3857 domain-containing protein n=1 Tax=Flavobacterium tyrosinilyticum TaxID=1658740 RepID=UPI00202F2676|nr:DUF3857 domain-containing protein [Flavobacterium tyrosinilyticum]MCM0665920.1 DUF3857 and transglutaminase domain-containing protein [Flavobacterium tyrosinilyticum]
MLRFLLICIALLGSTITIQAQNYDLGKVTIAELNEKVHPKDSSAPAAILFKKGRTYFGYNKDVGFYANHVCEVKIKIYKKEGLSWADQKVRFYIGYDKLNEDRLEFSDAVTYNLENGNIVKTKLNNQGEFKNKINQYWKEKTITLPNVKVGSIIEYKYVLRSENLVKFPDFDVQFSIPVDYFYYKTQIPEFYIYKPILIGGIPLETESKFTAASQSFDNAYSQTSSFSYKQIETFYKGKDVPALKEEPYINNLENYRGSIQQELERVRLPDQPVKDYSLTWEGVAKTIFKDDSFGKQLNQGSLFTDDLNKLLSNVEDKKERLNLIFTYVKNRMNWNEINSCYTEKGVEKAYKDQTGNVAEINFILINMLRAAGIEANPVLVSTIQNGLPVYPTRTGFNYVIVAAEIDGKKNLLDASHKLTAPNILPLNVLNWNGRLIKKDGNSEEIQLDPTQQSKEIYSLIVKINPDGKMNGQARVQRTDYDAYSFRVENNTKTEDAYLEKLENRLGGLEISNYAIENQKSNLDQSVIETFSFASSNRSDIIDGKIFVNPLLFFTQSKNPFNQEKRQMPVYFGYKNIEKFNLNIEIPQGYTVESLPKPFRISSEDKLMSFILNFSFSENKIQIVSQKEINSSIFVAEDYGMIKEFFQKMIVSQNEKIILKKI